jgi:hypothetical protein
MPVNLTDALLFPSFSRDPTLNAVGADPASLLANYEETVAVSAADKGAAFRLSQIGDSNHALRQNLARDAQAVETANFQNNALNERLLPVLKRITGQEFGAEPNRWKGWWINPLGYAFQVARSQPNPTFTTSSMRSPSHPYASLPERSYPPPMDRAR